MAIRAMAFLGSITAGFALVAYGETSDAEPMDLASVVSATAGSGSPQRPTGVKRKCAHRSEADFPGAYTSARNFVVGPLAMIEAGGRGYFSREFGGAKFPLLVENGHRVTLKLKRRVRRGASLAYGPLRRGRNGVRRGYRTITFVACREGVPSGSSADGTPVTFWSGGILARSRRCVPLRIWVDSETAPLREVIHLGVRRCA